jgi:hypothetical protein
MQLAAPKDAFLAKRNHTTRLLKRLIGTEIDCRLLLFSGRSSTMARNAAFFFFGLHLFTYPFGNSPVGVCGTHCFKARRF